MGLPDFLAAELRGLRDWLLPPACPLCRELLPAGAPDGFCPVCAGGILPLSSPRCPSCLLPYPAASGPDHPCGGCLGDPLPFVVLGAIGRHEGVLRDTIHRFKYRQGLALGPPLADRLAETAEAAVRSFDPELILPVPLHRRRLQERGYNQAWLLARRLGRRWQVEASARLLRRVGATPSQQGLDAAARRRNLAGSLQLVQPMMASRVLLVDDVMTTGATLRACAETLLDGGARAVGAVVLARAAGR